MDGWVSEVGWTDQTGRQTWGLLHGGAIELRTDEDVIHVPEEAVGQLRRLIASAEYETEGHSRLIRGSTGSPDMWPDDLPDPVDEAKTYGDHI